MRASRWRPLRHELVQPGDRAAPLRHDERQRDSYLPGGRARVGNIDPAFVQQMGDFDYGLRARQAGCSVWVAPGTSAPARSHPERRPGEQPLGEELRQLWSLKELDAEVVGGLLSPLGRSAVAAVLAEPVPAPAPDRAHAAAPTAARRAVSQFDPPASPDGSTMTARAVSGLRWSSLGYAALLVANVVYTVTMSRLLDPVGVRAHGAGSDRRAVRPVLRSDGAGIRSGAEAGALEGGCPGGVDCRGRRRRGAATRCCGSWPQ